MERVLVTGGNGYIGKHIVEEMKSQNIDFIVMDQFNANIDKDISFKKIDILNENLKDVYTEIKEPKVLLHLAWRNGFVHNDSCHMGDLSKHYNFVKDAIELGITHICVMGSMHEVGYHEGIIEENTPTNPQSQYAVAKNSLRQSLELLCKEKKITFQWIRGFYVYGDDLVGNSIFSKLQEASLNGKSSFPFTTGKNKFDFLSIYELAKQIVEVVSQKEIIGIINCCSGIPVSLSEQIEWYIKEYNLNIQLEYGKFPDREYDSPAIWGDNSKIKSIMKASKN